MAETATELRNAITEELQAIAKKHRGVLRPEDVVEFARDPETALHHRFQWDDGEAAHQWRLFQARQVIRCSVVVVPEKQKEYRAFVSLSPDRKEDGGGYRPMRAVLGSRKHRAQLLEDAIREMRVFRKKFAELKELSDVFAAMDPILTAS